MARENFEELGAVPVDLGLSDPMSQGLRPRAFRI
jgi:hypothetical protein